MGRTPFVALLTLALAGCAPRATIVVASKNFTEQVVLGEILAQHIERHLNVEVDRKLNLGGTLLAHQALISGQIDLYPEYSGTALTAILKMDPMDDPDAVEEAVRREYRARWDVEWRPGLGFNNAFAMVVRCEQARRENLRTLSDAARRPVPWRLGVGYEFVQRPDGLARLQAAYRLPLDGRPVDMDLGLLYRAVQQGQVDMAAGNATDGVIEALGLCVLDDDRRHFLPYRAAVAVRAEALSTHEGLRTALAALEGRIGEDAMRRMNAAVDGGKRPVAEVAREFLATL